MEKYRVLYIRIGGMEDYEIIEAESCYDAKQTFERTHWAYHEIVSVEPVFK